MTSQLQAEIDAISRSFPIMDRLGDHFERGGVLKGVKIGWHCHLTSLTAIAVGALMRSGAQLFMSECNRATTSPAAVVHMRQLGASVELGSSSVEKVLEKSPQLLSDVGFVLTAAYLRSNMHERTVRGASEITTSGISTLRELQPDQVSIPVININDGVLKSAIENFHGVGDGITDLLRKISPSMWSGRVATVFGYGRVGAGVAYYLHRIGMSVRVVERDPVRSLVAHYDGFMLAGKEDALKSSDLIVTATGAHGLIKDADWKTFKDGAIAINVGHWPDELGLDSLEGQSSESNEVSASVMEYVIADEAGSSKRVSVVAEGSPANVAMLTGSPEPTLIHMTTELLCLEHLHKFAAEMKAGENALPYEVEKQCAALALDVISI